jgi:hypothetical protein
MVPKILTFGHGYIFSNRGMSKLTMEFGISLPRQVLVGGLGMVITALPCCYSLASHSAFPCRYFYGINLQLFHVEILRHLMASSSAFPCRYFDGINLQLFHVDFLRHLRYWYVTIG